MNTPSVLSAELLASRDVHFFVDFPIDEPMPDEVLLMRRGDTVETASFGRRCQQGHHTSGTNSIIGEKPCPST